MKFIARILFCFCLSLCTLAFADQQTTVLEQKDTINKAQVSLPYIDGSNNTELEKQLNALLRQTAEQLTKKTGGGTLSYKVMLNRPSLVSVLLQAENNGKTVYEGLNLDLTSGREFSVSDFFMDTEAVKQMLNDSKNVLFGEQGVYLRTQEDAPYDAFIPYTQVMSSMRIGEAGRIMQIARLTAGAAGKTLFLQQPGLIALKLDSNPSTGFGWHFSCASANVSKVGSSFTMPAANDNRTGAPGVEVLVLSLDAPGTYEIKMEYRRAWERLSLQSFSFTVVVQEN